MHYLALYNPLTITKQVCMYTYNIIKFENICFIIKFIEYCRYLARRPSEYDVLLVMNAGPQKPPTASEMKTY